MIKNFESFNSDNLIENIEDILIDLDLIDLTTEIKIMDGNPRVVSKGGIVVHIFGKNSSYTREYHIPGFDKKNNIGFRFEDVSYELFRLYRFLKEKNYSHIFCTIQKINKNWTSDADHLEFNQIYIDLSKSEKDIFDLIKRKEIEKIDHINFTANK